MAAVKIDSGEFRTSIGAAGGDLDRVLGSWQMQIARFNSGADWLLRAVEEVDATRLWETYWGGMFAEKGRDWFIANKLLVNFAVVEDTVPAILERLKAGEAVTLTGTDGSTTRLQRNEKIRDLRERGLTQQAIAAEVGVSRGRVAQVLAKPTRTPKANKPRRKVTRYEISQYTTPATAARRIREVFGAKFAAALREALDAYTTM